MAVLMPAVSLAFKASARAWRESTASVSTKISWAEWFVSSRRFAPTSTLNAPCGGLAGSSAPATYGGRVRVRAAEDVASGELGVGQPLHEVDELRHLGGRDAARGRVGRAVAWETASSLARCMTSVSWVSVESSTSRRDCADIRLRWYWSSARRPLDGLHHAGHRDGVVGGPRHPDARGRLMAGLVQRPHLGLDARHRLAGDHAVRDSQDILPPRGFHRTGFALMARSGERTITSVGSPADELEFRVPWRRSCAWTTRPPRSSSWRTRSRRPATEPSGCATSRRP